MAEWSIKRILMTTDTVGGVWTFGMELARQFTEWGLDLVLATLGEKPSPQQTEEAERISGLLLVPGNFRLEWMEDPWSDVEASGEWLLRLEREFQPDVVHLNSFGHGGLPWHAPVVLTAHSCVLSWWRAVKNEPAPPAWARYRGTVKRALESADVVTCPTAAMASDLERDYSFGASRVSVIPNGRDKTLFHPGMKEPLILTAGRLWDEAKNTRAVARAADSLPWPVYAAGGNQSPAGEALHFPGARMLGQLPAPELAQWLARAAIFALPARYDPFGLAALEAGLAGCALVLGDIPSQHEIWGDAALFVNPHDDSALRATLHTLIADEALRVDMANRSYARALTFTPAHTAAGYLEAFHTAVAHSALRILPCVS